MEETAVMEETAALVATEEMRMIMAPPVALAVSEVHRTEALGARALTASLRWG